MKSDKILVRGAREHNLKNIDVEIPRDQLVVITGLSGSGKSSLAFDTIYAEGQRRYVESLSAYARQFLGQLEKPDVDQIDGLSPAIAIDQKGTSRNPRSTVGTVTEVYDHLRLLFARIGIPHCPICGRVISSQSPQDMANQIFELDEGSRIMILGPVVRDRKGQHKGVFEQLRSQGFVRVRVDGEIRDLDEAIELEKSYKHSIDVVVDRIVVRHNHDDDDRHALRIRVLDSLETALQAGDGNVIVSVIDGPELKFSEAFACPEHGISIPELEPRTFSFNSPHGACQTCDGLGISMEFDEDLIVPDKSISLQDGAIAPWSSKGRETHRWYTALIEAVSDEYDIPLDVAWRDLPPAQRKIVLNGTGSKRVQINYTTRNARKRRYKVRYDGVIPTLQRRLRDTTSDYVREELESYMASRPCPDCGGHRLRPEILAVTVADTSISNVTRMSVVDAWNWITALRDGELSDREQLIARQIIKEIGDRLGFLVDVGLDYLTLDRSAGSLSGGEAQRIRLATQIGSRLMGVLYVLDEPSIGLHQRDNARLIATLESLRDIGNTILVVEHDEETMRAADWIIDIGPGAGERGGLVVAAGTFDTVAATEESITGQYLSGSRIIPIPTSRRKGTGKSLKLVGASENNLKDVTVDCPLGTFICVTGVSGSGKSSLISDTLYPKLAQVMFRAKARPGRHEAIQGLEHVDKVVEIDQSPIGRTPRSNPATYTGVFTYIRDLFASMPEAKTRGYKPGRFSFNVKGGRCEACKGDGIIKIEMQFLPDVFVPCEICNGRRYNEEALEIHYRGQSIADVLEMTVDEALEHFENIPRVVNKLQTISDVGLGYIRLGQPATQLSGGEAQRVKLATELSKRATGQTIYILDEPTTGLHYADIDKLLQVLQRLTEGGNTIIVIEHNLDVIKSADWLIDLGPEGGDLGGEVVTIGTPEEVAETNRSYTGQALRAVLPEIQLAAD
ncbi:excinuclease ABC subunit UvrA [soil metagenome]